MKNNILMSVLLTASLSAALPLSAASHVDVEDADGEPGESFGNRNFNPSLLLADYF